MGKVIRMYPVGRCWVCRKRAQTGRQRMIVLCPTLLVDGRPRLLEWAHRKCLRRVCFHVAEHLSLMTPRIAELIGSQEQALRQRVETLRMRLNHGKGDHNSVLLEMKRFLMILRDAILLPGNRSRNQRIYQCMEGLKHLSREHFRVELQTLPSVVKTRPRAAVTRIRS